MHTLLLDIHLWDGQQHQIHIQQFIQMDNQLKILPIRVQQLPYMRYGIAQVDIRQAILQTVIIVMVLGKYLIVQFRDIHILMEVGLAIIGHYVEGQTFTSTEPTNRAQTICVICNELREVYCTNTPIYSTSYSLCNVCGGSGTISTTVNHECIHGYLSPHYK